MKKLICLLMIATVLLSCCACGNEETTTTPATEPSETVKDLSTPEGMFGHIDQTVPVDGVYKIWNEVGVKNMANHPDGKFELLCDVDMKGAVLKPIGTDETPFTGTIEGTNYNITNFTVQGGEEQNFGFVTVNKGTIQNIRLGDITFIPGPNAKNIGSFAGDNQGLISRCAISGSMNVDCEL